MHEQSVAAALELEHHEIDAGLSRFSSSLADGYWQPVALRSAAAALRRHIYLEEQFLFPPLRELGLIAPVAVMLREHGEIWQALSEIERLAGGGAERNEVQRVYLELTRLLEDHNQKKEVILYPAADGVLDAAEHARLSERIAGGTLPDGWTCERARPTSDRTEGGVSLGLAYHPGGARA